MGGGSRIGGHVSRESREMKIFNSGGLGSYPSERATAFCRSPWDIGPGFDHVPGFCRKSIIRNKRVVGMSLGQLRLPKRERLELLSLFSKTNTILFISSSRIRVFYCIDVFMLDKCKALQ